MSVKKKVKILILRSGLYGYLFTAINILRKIRERLSYLNLFFPRVLEKLMKITLPPDCLIS